MQQQNQGGGGGLSMPDPQTMATLMQNPMYQQMMQQVMSNPQLMEQMFRSHPMFANNPQAAEMARQSAQMVRNLRTTCDCHVTVT
jgi:ubiquilin